MLPAVDGREEEFAPVLGRRSGEAVVDAVALFKNCSMSRRVRNATCVPRILSRDVYVATTWLGSGGPEALGAPGTCRRGSDPNTEGLTSHQREPRPHTGFSTRRPRPPTTTKGLTNLPTNTDTSPTAATPEAAAVAVDGRTRGALDDDDGGLTAEFGLPLVLLAAAAVSAATESGSVLRNAARSMSMCCCLESGLFFLRISCWPSSAWREKYHTLGCTKQSVKGRN